MKKLLIIVAITAAGLAAACAPKEVTLKERFADKFLVGTALNVDYIWERDPMANELIRRQFNAVVPENAMKSMFIQPREGEFFWDDADRFVEYGEQSGMWVTGHCLVWHSQTPDWLFVDSLGNDVSKEVLIERMRTHIYAVVGRYKGRIKGWDVVNEAIMEDGSWRQSKFYTIIGEEFIPLAFRFAHEADPDAELYYNDYNEWHEGKVATIVKLVRELKAQGLRIDAVGMQAHFGMDYPSESEYQAALDAYSAAGVKTMITEMDMSALPRPSFNMGANIADTVAFRAAMDPYTAGLPDSVSAVWNKRMAGFMRLFEVNADKISRVTFWGVTDASSWKNGFPMPGRTDYALPFDRQYRLKGFVKEM